MDQNKFAIDANIIIRYLINDGGDLAKKAIDIMDAVDEERLSVYCDPINLAEVVWVLDSFYNVSREEISLWLQTLLSNPCFVVVNKEHYRKAIDIYASKAASFADACACVTAIEEAKGNLFSFDKKLSKVEKVNRLEHI